MELFSWLSETVSEAGKWLVSKEGIATAATVGSAALKDSKKNKSSSSSIVPRQFDKPQYGGSDRLRNPYESKEAPVVGGNVGAVWNPVRRSTLDADWMTLSRNLIGD